jgi:hypothetical protein
MAGLQSANLGDKGTILVADGGNPEVNESSLLSKFFPFIFSCTGKFGLMGSDGLARAL